MMTPFPKPDPSPSFRGVTIDHMCGLLTVVLVNASQRDLSKIKDAEANIVG